MFIDFKELKGKLDITDVAKQLGLTLKEKDDQYRCACPRHGEDDERSMVVTPNDKGGMFYCFATGEGGDVLSFYAHVKKCSVKEAAQSLAGKKPESEEGFRPLDGLDPLHMDVSSLGIDPDDARRIGAGYCKRGILRGHVAWPVRDETGRLLGYIGLKTYVKLPPRFL